MKMTYRTLAVVGLVLLLAVGLSGAVMTGYAAIGDDAPAQDDPTTTPGITDTPAPTATVTQTPLPAIAEGALTGTVIRASVLLVREAPYLGADVITRVRRGETYAVVGRDPEASWYRIQTAAGPGWVWGYYLFVDGNEFNANETNPFENFGDPSNTAAYVVQSTATLKLRARPNVASEQIGRVEWGDTLPVIGRARVGSWYQVVYKDTVGWVFSPYTDPVEGNLADVPYVEADPFPPPAVDFEGESNVQVIIVTPTITSSPSPVVIIVTATPTPTG
jgi:uncharacterized protein YgiM (DUF1202 family)